MRKIEREREPKKTVPTEKMGIKIRPTSHSWLRFHSLSVHASFLDPNNPSLRTSVHLYVYKMHGSAATIYRVLMT